MSCAPGSAPPTWPWPGYMASRGSPATSSWPSAQGPPPGQRVVGDQCGLRHLRGSAAGTPALWSRTAASSDARAPSPRAELPAANLHPVPEGVSDEAAVFTEPSQRPAPSGGPAKMADGTPALVVGDGRLGRSVPSSCSAGAHDGPRPAPRTRRAPAEPALGDPNRTAVYVVEATGAWTASAALDLVGPRGPSSSRPRGGPSRSTSRGSSSTRSAWWPPVRALRGRADLSRGAVDPTPLLDAELLRMGPEALARGPAWTLKVLIRNAATAPS